MGQRECYIYSYNNRIKIRRIKMGLLDKAFEQSKINSLDSSDVKESW